MTDLILGFRRIYTEIQNMRLRDASTILVGRHIGQPTRDQFQPLYGAAGSLIVLLPLQGRISGTAPSGKEIDP